MPSDQSDRPSTPARAQRTRAYFESVYPVRKSNSGRCWARAHEDRRIAVVREWLQECHGTDVLDVGCGDGFFLDAVLPSRISRVRVEDLVPACVSAAARRIGSPGRTVEAVVADINEPAHDGDTFDVVLAIGVTDYNPDWDAVLANLCLRARGTVIVDFPLAGGLRAVARRSWLRWHGVTLRYTTLEELRPLLARHARDIEAVDLGLNCAVKMTLAS